MNIIRTDSLTKIYGDEAHKLYALKDVTFSTEEGEFVAIMGPSGSGKSTLLYLLGGLDHPTNGKVYLREKDISTLPDNALSEVRRQQIGFIFQFFNLIPVLTAQENVAIPLILDGVPRSEALSRAEQALQKVGLADRKSHRPSELSGGQQQRVAIARALVTNPAIILADEPTGNLDSKTSDEVISLLRNIVDEYKRTMIIVTHDPRVAAHADRIVFLKDGEIADENHLKGYGNEAQIREQLGRITVH
ncbi:MAG: ABC transporter ATP-binding protein [Chloroflexi bacterium]|nr:ABC transporter ATP-binding protein [Chloroflexota bacterium]